jgi:hypothetical protein
VLQRLRAAGQTLICTLLYRTDRIRRYALGFSIVLIALILTLPRYSIAGSAWVLWSEEYRYSKPSQDRWLRQERQWHVLSGFSDLASCQDGLKDWIEKTIINASKARMDDADLMYKATEDTLEFLYFPKHAKETDTVKSVQKFRYLCLPETTDPRDSK